MTTTSIEHLSALTSTAVASYATLNPDSLKATLLNGGANFVATQSDTFITQYQLLDQRPNVPLNGFSATAFQDTVSGKRAIAMRGTETNVLGQILLDGLLTEAVSSLKCNTLQTVELDVVEYFSRGSIPEDLAWPVVE